MRIKIQQFKIFGIQQKQSREGNTSLNKLENSNTQANLSPKGTGDRVENKTYTKQKKRHNNFEYLYP